MSSLKVSVNAIVQPIVDHLHEVDSKGMIRTLWIEGQLEYLLFVANQEPDPVVELTDAEAEKPILRNLIQEALNRKD